MTEPNYISIGFTRKTHGVQGELKAAIEPEFLPVVLEKGRVFFDIRGKKVPHFVGAVRGAGEPIVKLEDVNTREDALPLQSRELFLLDTDLPVDFASIEEDELEYGYLVDFQLTDKTLGPIGKIESVVEMPQQEMAAVQYRGREVLVPLNEHFIVAVDQDARVLTVALPEGLLDI